MATFKAPETRYPDVENVTRALGASTSTPLTDKDLGKTVKLSGDSTYVLTAAGDEIEGILESVNPETVNSGYGLGTVQVRGQIRATLDVDPTGHVGEYVCAGTQVARGTALTNYAPVVIPDGDPYTVPTKFRWRILSIINATAKTVLLERVN